VRVKCSLHRNRLESEGPAVLDCIWKPNHYFWDGSTSRHQLESHVEIWSESAIAGVLNWNFNLKKHIWLTSNCPRVHFLWYCYTHTLCKTLCSLIAGDKVSDWNPYLSTLALMKPTLLRQNQGRLLFTLGFNHTGTFWGHEDVGACMGTRHV